MWFRKMICYFFGHRSIITYTNFINYTHKKDVTSERISYTCERCGHER